MSSQLAAALADFPFAFSELALMLVGYVLCLLQCWDLLGWTLRRAVTGGLVVVTASAVLAVPCALFDGDTNLLLFPILAAAVLLLRRAPRLDGSRALFVVGTAAYLCSTMTFLAIVADAFALAGDAQSPYLGVEGARAQWVVALALTAALWVPIRRYFPPVLASASASRAFWHVAWMPSVFMCGVLVLCVPIDPGTLLVNRVGPLCVVILLAALAFMAMVYLMLFRLVLDAEASARMQEENRQLAMRALQVEHLDERIVDARRARHDERQHLHALVSLADRGDIEGLRGYLGELDERAASTETPIQWCKNPVVNGIAVYYLDRLREQSRGRGSAGTVAVDVQLDLPERLGIADTELSVLFGNLLENATDALLLQKSGARWLRVRARGGAGAPVVLTVDNSCDREPPRRDASGAYCSSKHEGAGIGLSSVAFVVSQHGGTLKVEPTASEFRVSVMLPL